MLFYKRTTRRCSFGQLRPEMIAAAAIVGSLALVAWCVWLDDRRRRERDADLIGEVHACRREVAELERRLRRGDALAPDEVTP